uniref:Uncharacterized protein n=1 Tax=Moniliophthora roreri TaxID=221103 RepID=A0A0W0FWW5_MONRR
MFNGKHPCNYPPLLEFLLPAFELAKKWGFQQLAMDIGHQAGLLMSSPVQKVAVGHRYAVLPWYRSGLEELVTSDDDITLEDAGEIGFPLALRLYHARARYGRSMRDRRHEEHGTVASGIVESMFAEDLAIFPASRSEVIQNEDQLHQVEQADETETETVIVTAGDAEGFEMIARDQGSSDTETEDSESRKGTDDAEKAIESVDECAEVQQEKPNTEGALSENPASSLVEPTSQATTESEPACATRRSNEDAKPDSRRSVTLQFSRFRKFE